MSWAKDFALKSKEELEKPPYTFLNDRLYNMKDREVACFNCKYKIMSHLPEPKCGICHANLVTTPKETGVV